MMNRIQPKASNPRTYILDSAVWDIGVIGQCLHMGICVDADGGRVLGHGLSTSADDALITALCNAVVTDGFPGTVLVDNAADMPDLVRECWLMGAQIAHVQPFGGTATPTEPEALP